MASKRKKPTETPNEQLPSEVVDLLAQDDEGQKLLDELSAQSQCMSNIAAFLKNVEVCAGQGANVFHRSGYKGIASHFKRLQETGRELTRQLDKAKPHGKLVLGDHPLVVAPPDEPAAEAEPEGLTPLGADE